MNLFDKIRTVIAYLRGDSSVTRSDFLKAIADLTQAGLYWLASLAGEGGLTRGVLPVDCHNRAAMADLLEAHCGTAERMGAADPAGSLPWNVLLPAILSLLEQIINGLL